MLKLGTTALDPGAASDVGTKLLFLRGLKHLSVFLHGSDWEPEELHSKQ